MKRRVGILGGTFNPPHLGHLYAAQTVREALTLDEVWLVPTQTPPHKPLPPGSATAQERLEMVELAVADLPGLKACGIELTLPPPSYTSRTITELVKQHPDTDFWWIVGADMLMTLHSWVAPDVIFANCRIAAMAREEDQLNTVHEHAEYLRRHWNARIDVVETPPMPLSSTQVRDQMQQGAGNQGLPAQVAAYIEEKGLYRL